MKEVLDSQVWRGTVCIDHPDCFRMELRFWFGGLKRVVGSTEVD